MDKFLIKGPAKLKGSVKISGSKNAALPIMVACIGYPGIYTLNNVPDLRDTRTITKLMQAIGCKIHSNKNTFIINSIDCNNPVAPYDLVKTMRASFYVLGPLLSRFKKAKVSLPGGCAWGPRPVDFHIKAFEKMGINIALDKGYVFADGELDSTVINFKTSSVGATGNVLMGCTNLDKEVIINNAAREPEIVDLCNFLTKIGMSIDGIGTSILRIKGIPNSDNKTRKITYDIIPDRIEAGTFLIAALMTKSEITLNNLIVDHIQSIIDKAKEIGAVLSMHSKNSLTIKYDKNIKAIDIKTDIYPGFPTDMQPQWISLMSVCKGESKVKDTVYFDRFSHIPELIRMGANIKLDKNIATIKGVETLSGTEVMAGDLRAGAALVLAALCAKHDTIISRVYHIDRGYEDIESKLKSLNVDIVRLK
ncbi:MAG: UDP-N-acetylglucosamine 1-carboxyvinyltransferase [Candidatus Marinimicrobia bacterium]|nr:UDP-N-acetylglucosamine 1-carboxyvinyltransferase [Candidatus Neomarinimicrobiota bacterium]|tara:strand:- start:33801 stop:35063 length:1263 start_codon:yes stop_codon:yes gene_type:complete